MAATIGFTAAQSRLSPHSGPAEPTLALRRTHLVSVREVAGRPVLRLDPRAPADGRHLLFTHGGGFAGTLDQAHWWLLRSATQGTTPTITVPLYRTSTEGGGPDQAAALLREVYDDLLTEAPAGRITLAGDSAGGTLALTQALAFRDAGLPLPRQLLLFYPWLDLTMSHRSLAAQQEHDPVQTIADLHAKAATWAGDRDLRDPLISPAFADLSGLPTMHLFQGGRDLFAPEVLEFADKVKAAGGNATTTYEPTGYHAYLGAVYTPEARRSLRVVRTLLR